MSNVNPIYILESDDNSSSISLWTVGGISALVMRFFKLKQKKEIFLSQYPTPQSLQEKLSEVMDRNPMARKIYTKLDGMTQSKYIWWVKIELLHSYNIWRILGNFLLSPIAMLYQGGDMVKNKYYTTAGDILNNKINSDRDMDRMYYSIKSAWNDEDKDDIIDKKNSIQSI